jgi:hypothetical protein
MGVKLDICCNFYFKVLFDPKSGTHQEHQIEPGVKLFGREFIKILGFEHVDRWGVG